MAKHLSQIALYSGYLETETAPEKIKHLNMRIATINKCIENLKPRIIDESK